MLSKILYQVGVMALALTILFLSMTRVGYDLIAQEDGVTLVKNREVKFMVTNDEGDTSPSSYKLPEVGTLPDNLMYGFKKIRDYFWLAFSHGNKKIKLSILIADKKIVEFSELVNKDKNDTAIEAGNEAIDKLEYADSLIAEVPATDVEAKELHRQILLAGLAYKELIKQSELKFGIDIEKYSKLISRIDERNKTQEKNRYGWDY